MASGVGCYRNPGEPLQLKLHQLHFPFRFEKTFPEQLLLSKAADDNLSQVSPIQVSRCSENYVISKKTVVRKTLPLLQQTHKKI